MAWFRLRAAKDRRSPRAPLGGAEWGRGLVGGGADCMVAAESGLSAYLFLFPLTADRSLLAKHRQANSGSSTGGLKSALPGA